MRRCSDSKRDKLTGNTPFLTFNVEEEVEEEEGADAADEDDEVSFAILDVIVKSKKVLSASSVC